MSPSSLLYANPSNTVLLLDIPTSVELAQYNPPSLKPTRRLISSPPLECPYPSTEPKTAKARAKLPEASIEELFLQKHIQFALEELNGDYAGEWCLPRITSEGGDKHHSEESIGDRPRKRRKTFPDPPFSDLQPANPILLREPQAPSSTTLFFPNPDPTTARLILPFSSPSPILHHIPPLSTLLLGQLSHTVPTLLIHAPLFNLIVLDPPWPNRSARRSKRYPVPYGNGEIHQLLKEVPVREKLADNGVVAVWITNRDVFEELVVGKEGLFVEWGLQFVEDWVWVKVTKCGEAVGPLDGVWRKPYERLLIGRRKVNSSTEHEQASETRNGPKGGGGVKKRIIFAVPDLHSRKPNLKELAERCLNLAEDGKYDALEVFARNMTAGWWSWGGEACKFQGEEYWTG